MKDAREYNRRKKQGRYVSILSQIAVLALYAVTVGASLHGIVEKYFDGVFLQRALFLIFFYLAWQITRWPVAVGYGWELDKNFEMTRQTFGGWLVDYLKGRLLGMLFFAVSGLVFFAVVEGRPVQAWWILAALTFGFSAFVSTVFPVLILPLFHKTVPLADTAMVARLQRILQRCGLPKLPIYEIKLGQKTVRANAMLTGFGATRRALLSDTLLSGYEPAEIEMVLAHEAGHDVRRHLFRGLIIEAVTAGAAFFILFRLFGAAKLLDLSFFPVLSLLSYLSSLAALPLMNSLSRLHEREADRFALERFPDLPVFRSLMDKLSENNLADPQPGKLEEFLFYTHPSKRNRVRHAEEFLRARLANSTQAV